MSNKLVVINHPDSVQLFSQIEDAHKTVMALVQKIYQRLDDKTPEGKEWAKELETVQSEEQKGYDAALSLIHQNNVMHTTILVINEQQASMMTRLENLESKFGSGRPERNRRREHASNDRKTAVYNQVMKTAQSNVRR